MNRRQFLQVAAAGALAVGCSRAGAWQDAAAGRPNVLFIAVDDLNDWSGCLAGHPQAKTPNLDRLAGRGVLFTKAYCAAPACGPSRAALLTGIKPATSGMYFNGQHFRDSPALKDAVTLPQHFMAHGYRVTGSGKIYHGGDEDPASWQEYWPSQEKNKPEDPMPANRPLNGIARTSHFDWGPIANAATEMGDWQVADWVCAQLRQAWDKPFFLGCGFYRPHLPWYVPQKYFDQFPLDQVILPEVDENDLDDVPEAGVRMAKPNGDHRKVTEADQWRQAVRGYLASISFMDECLGRVIDALDASPHRENTIVVLWSDHGWHLGEKLHWRKFALWEEATHNHLLFVAPGVTRSGGRCDEPVSLLDIYPTMLELCRLSAMPGLEGRSLMPQLRDPAAVADRPALTTHGRANHSLRDRRWRYIRYDDGSEELYDHDADPLEHKNLARDSQYQSVIAGLRAHLPRIDAEMPPGRGRRSSEDDG